MTNQNQQKSVRRSSELVKISVLAKLSGVPAPTIKHYMREGLLPEPARRTSRNMSYYDVRLAERIQVIKQLQKERFLPLKIIGEILEPPPSAEIRKDLSEVHRKQLGALEPAVRAGHRESRRRRGGRSRTGKSRTEILENHEVSTEDLALLERLGLINHTKDREPVYQGPELDLLDVISETRKKGLGDLFPMEILEPYAREIRRLVSFEIDLFRQRVLEGESLPTGPLDEIAREVAMLGERLVMAMRARLITVELRAQAMLAGDDEQGG